MNGSALNYSSCLKRLTSYICVFADFLKGPLIGYLRNWEHQSDLCSCVGRTSTSTKIHDSDLMA